MTGVRMRSSCRLSAVLSVAVLAVGTANAENTPHLNLNLSWGHTSPAASPFYIQFLGQNVMIDRHTDQDLESGRGEHEDKGESDTGLVRLQVLKQPPHQLPVDVSYFEFFALMAHGFRMCSSSSISCF